jgi:hypothetical protein
MRCYHPFGSSSRARGEKNVRGGVSAYPRLCGGEGISVIGIAEQFLAFSEAMVEIVILVMHCQRNHIF